MAESRANSRAVEAARRVRQQAVDAAATEHHRRTAVLAEATAARDAVADTLTRAAADHRPAPGTRLSLDALLRFQAWSAVQQGELVAAEAAEATAQSAADEARTAVTVALQGRRVIERWQSRRETAVRAIEQRRDQHALDDSAAQRHGRVHTPHTPGSSDGD